MSAIEVSGGAAGLSVGLDELEESARRLRSLALDLGEVAASIGLAATDPRLALAGLLAPVEYLAAEGALLGCIGPHGAALSLIHISEPTRRLRGSRMPSSA